MSVINGLNALQRLIISVLLAAIGYYLTGKKVESSILHLLIFWDIFSISLLGLHWITFFTVDSPHIKAEANKQDEGRIAAFIIALVATLAALLAAVSLLISKKGSFSEMTSSLLIAFGGLILSWALMHTNFAIRYAHVYYSAKASREGGPGGLAFPEDKHPDFLDFAYYSFVIGMTFQVSDVSITSSKMRRLTLLHSLMAFAFNTVIVALTVNVIAGLSK